AAAAAAAVQRPFGQPQLPHDYGDDNPTNVDEVATHIYDPPSESERTDDSGLPPSRHSPTSRRRK
ncbi:MAG: hypothetical protein H0T65_18775, partial [Deltaproteobacteria bacterium]|nr:hypothetical protein [Deltaproteobacteria bacterium]